MINKMIRKLEEFGELTLTIIILILGNAIPWLLLVGGIEIIINSQEAYAITIGVMIILVSIYLGVIILLRTIRLILEWEERTDFTWQKN